MPFHAFRPKTEDHAILEKLGLLLLLGFLSNYDLFDEVAAGAEDRPGSPNAGATFPAPAGSKGYRLMSRGQILIYHV